MPYESPWQQQRRSSVADEIDYEIKGQELQFLEIELDPGEAAVGEAGIVMNVNAVPCRFAVARNLENAFIEIGLFDVRCAIGRGAFPAVADALEPIARFVALERIVEEQGALGLQPGSVGRRWHGRRGRLGGREG